MLISYAVENFKSYKTKSTFSLFSKNSKVKKRYLENFRTIDDVDIFKTAIIVGENAGGKTNFIESLDFLKDYLFGTVDKRVKTFRNCVFYHTWKKDADFLYEKKNIDKTKQSFSIEILGSDLNIYKYVLVIDYFGIRHESLSKRSSFKMKGKNVFDVSRDSVELDESGNTHYSYTIGVTDSFNKDENNNTIICQSALDNNNYNGLYVKAFSLLGLKEATIFTNWINDNLDVSIERIPLDILYRIETEKVDEKMISILEKSEFLDIFRLVDSSISSIEVDEVKPFEDTLIVRKIKEKKETIKTKLAGDSSGVRQFFSLAYDVYKVIYEGKVVFADEFDSFLNPILTSRLVSYINSFESTGQFIFTTHNIMHLNFQSFMKEQMYITHKDKASLESSIYSLCSFKDLRYDANQRIYELYYKGLLGGVDNEQ